MKHFLNTIFYTFLIAGASFTNPAFANNGTTTAASKPAWSVDCSNRLNPTVLNCQMQQTVFAGQSKARIFSATIQEAGNVHLLKLALPHGLNLMEGVRLSVDDGQVITYPIVTADVNGSYAHIALTEELSASMKAGNILSLNVVASSSNSIELQLSLTGFSAAYDLFSKY